MTVMKGPSRKKPKAAKPEITRLSLFSPPQEETPAAQKRAVIQKDIGPKAKGPLPHFGAKHPEHAYARGETPVPPSGQEIPPQYGTPEPAQAPIPEAAPPSSGSGMGIFITGFIIFITIFFVLLTMNDDNGGGYCQTTCDGYSISVAPGCDCPTGSRYYDTITNGPCVGCKQCICG